MTEDGIRIIGFIFCVFMAGFGCGMWAWARKIGLDAAWHERHRKERVAQIRWTRAAQDGPTVLVTDSGCYLNGQWLQAGRYELPSSQSAFDQAQAAQGAR
jgi:hypothetical protein